MARLRQLVKMQKATVLESDNANGKVLLSLPRSATLLGMWAQVITAFDGTAPTLDLGIGTDENYWVNARDLSSTGFFPLTMLQGGHLEDLGLNAPVIDVTATVNVTGTPTKGEVLVIVMYADPFINPGAA